MPNRIMREGALHSRAVNAVSRDAELLWRRIMQIADDWGLFEADPFSLKSKCYGARADVLPEQCDTWLEELAAQKLVQLYEIEGRELGAVSKWEQRRFATRPKYPLPPWGETHILGGYVDPRARPGYEAPAAKAKRKRAAPKGNGEDKPAAEPFALPDWIPAETWGAWLKTRTRKKASNDKHALDLSVRDLEKLREAGHDPRACIEQSIKRGYTGLFPPRDAAPASQAAETELGRCRYCAEPATQRTNSIAHCERLDHLDMAQARRQ